MDHLPTLLVAIITTSGGLHPLGVAVLLIALLLRISLHFTHLATKCLEELSKASGSIAQIAENVRDICNTISDILSKR